MKFKRVELKNRGMLFLFEAYILPIGFFIGVAEFSKNNPIFMNTALGCLALYYLYHFYLASKGTSLFRQFTSIQVFRYKNGKVSKASPFRLLLRECVKFPFAGFVAIWELTKFALAFTNLAFNQENALDRRIAEHDFAKASRAMNRDHGTRSIIDAAFSTIVLEVMEQQCQAAQTQSRRPKVKKAS